MPRDEVMAELHRSVQAMRYSYSIPLERIAGEGFSGVLLGPDGDHDAKKVAQVLFTTDPAKLSASASNTTANDTPYVWLN